MQYIYLVTLVVFGVSCLNKNRIEYSLVIDREIELQDSNSYLSLRLSNLNYKELLQLYIKDSISRGQIILYADSLHFQNNKSASDGESYLELILGFVKYDPKVAAELYFTQTYSFNDDVIAIIEYYKANLDSNEYCEFLIENNTTVFIEQCRLKYRSSKLKDSTLLTNLDNCPK